MKAVPSDRKVANKLRAAQIEAFAVACCYAEFAHEEALRHTPIGYWRGVADEPRKFYRKQAEAILSLVQNYPVVTP